MTWAERAADRSPVVQRSRARGVEQATAIVEAAVRLISVNKSGFTTQELVKEAGIALQTFYRYFEGKDQLVLAVLEHMVSGASAHYREGARGLDDPLFRLRFYLTSVVMELGRDESVRKAARFLTTERWRLQSLDPEAVAHATRAFTDLVRGEIELAGESGTIRPLDTAYSAWLITQLVTGVYHHYAFAEPAVSYEQIADGLWDFCAAALGVEQREPPNPSLRVLPCLDTRPAR